MNAPVVPEPDVELDFDEPDALVFDFEECPAPLDQDGYATWCRLFALQANVIVTRQRRHNRELLATLSGSDTFSLASARADAKAKLKPSPEILRARRLLDDNVSLDRAWAEINDSRNRPTPPATIEAIMYCVRERGIRALKEPANVERLSRCDAAAMAQINKRIAKMKEATR
jgi:hypothetical protein